MIYHKDFIPQTVGTKSGLIFSEKIYENTASLIERMNKFIEEEKVTVINVETLLVARNRSGIETLDDTTSTIFNSDNIYYSQTIRLWYQD